MAEARAVNVIVKPAGLTKPLTYLLPEALNSPVAKRGAIVQIPLRGRTEQGWIVDLDVSPPKDVELLEIKAVVGIGPSEEILDLIEWVAWRWQASRASFYQLASPPRRIIQLPGRMSNPQAANQARHTGAQGELSELFQKNEATLWQLPPTAENWSLINTAMSRGDALVLLPQKWRAERLAKFARSRGHHCVLWPEQWETAAGGGCSVVGSRSAVFATMPQLAAIVMLDEHDENFKETWRKSAWHARDVVQERARRLAIPLVMASPVPSLDAQQNAEVKVPTSLGKKARWPKVVISDLRERQQVGLFSRELTELLTSSSKAVCVLNRTGRVRLLACAGCGSLLICQKCGGRLEQLERSKQVLTCSRCSAEALRKCSQCPSETIRNVRVGVAQAAQELSRLLREPVGEITVKDQTALHSRVLLGTTTALRLVDKCELVAFLEFDQFLLTPHYRAEEKALILLAQAARLVKQDGIILLQTRQPDNLAIRAAAESNPGLLSQADSALRQELLLPPTVAVALLSGPDVSEYIRAISELAQLSQPEGVALQGPNADKDWLLRAPNHEVLLEVLESVSREGLDVKICVDPPDL